MRLLMLPVFLGLAAFAPAQGQRWKEIGKTSAGNIIYYDPKSVKIVNGVTDVTMQVKFVKPPTVGKGKWYFSRHEVMFDCTKRYVASKYNKYYGDPAATKVVQQDIIKIP